mgnify:CR=1 FL=1
MDFYVKSTSAGFYIKEWPTKNKQKSYLKKYLKTLNFCCKIAVMAQKGSKINYLNKVEENNNLVWQWKIKLPND